MAATVDSIQAAHQSDYKKNVFGIKSIGKLHKGHEAVAVSASIPSKFQTIVIRSNEKKGFGSCSSRFHLGHGDDSPGPAKYSLAHVPEHSCNVSLSKKGLGSFVSKVKRFPRHVQQTCVGPGHYDPNLISEHYFNKSGCTSNFHKPIAVQVGEKFPTPAPNAYSFSPKVTGRLTYDNNVAACAAFLSRSKRELVTAKAASEVPAPSAYNLNDRLLRPGSRAAVASFKSSSVRELHPRAEPNPGPGAYHPFEPVKPASARRHRRKYYLCMSAPAVPMPPDPPPPGPGQYDLVNYSGPERQDASSSVFVSTTNRLSWGSPCGSSDKPGPASYNPKHAGKQSFIYNPVKKWI